MIANKSKTLERQFTISSSISSINIASRNTKQPSKTNRISKQANNGKHGKTPMLDTRQNMHKFKSSPYLKCIERFKELALSPGALPHIQSRVLSPISRAERVLKKNIIRNHKPEIELDSSIEASLEKIADHNFEFDKNDKFMTIFSSSKGSDKNDNEDVYLKVEARGSNKPVPSSPFMPLDHEANSRLKTNAESHSKGSTQIRHRVGNIHQNKKIFDSFYKNLEFKPNQYGLNVY